MSDFWNVLKLCFKKWHCNTTPHFHSTNFFAKEYFPIYIAFGIFSGIYIPQYVMQKLWNRIIFDIILGVTVGVIVFFTRKYTQYTQFCFTLLYMFGAILLDKLVNDDLKRHELLFLGIYISILYYNMVKGPNNFLSNIAFFFMLMYFSAIYLTSLADLTTFFGNITICCLQCYMTWTDNKHKLMLFEKQNNEKKKWMHIFNKVFPGVTILFKKNLNFGNKNFQENFLDLEFINKKGQEIYKIENELNQIKSFLSEILILTPPDKTDNGFASKMTDAEVPIQLLDLLLKTADSNFTLENNVLGFHQKLSIKMRIWITSFDWNEEKLLLVHLDDDHLEEEIKKLQENDIKKNELLASVTHDLRSPLNGILAFINNAKTTENHEDRTKFLHYAEINGNLLMSLINDILDYSSFLNEKFNLIKEKFSLKKLLDEVIDLMATQAAAKKILLKLENEFNEGLFLFSDGRRLKQILINLIGNSIKFTMKGFIKIKILKTDHKNVVKFEVIDTGVGIKKETIDKLSKPYSSFDTPEGLNKYGIGLGLNICRKFISLLGPKDQMNITSEYGKGTKISFFIFINNSRSEPNCLSPLILESKIKVTKASSEDFINFKPHQSKITSSHPFFRPKSPKKMATKIWKGDEQPASISMLLETKARTRDFKPYMNCILNSDSNFANLKAVKPCSNYLYKVIKTEFKLNFSSFGSSASEENFSDIEDSGGIFNKMSSYTNAPKISSLIPLEKSESLQSIHDGIIDSSPDSETRQLNHQKNSFSFDFKRINDGKMSFKVLIADDNPFNAFVITSYLVKIKNLNISYDISSNGVECITKFKERNLKPNTSYFNIIFMDCLMPIKDGYEAASEIKSLMAEGKYNNTFIIGVTGLSGIEEEKKCLENGMDGFVSKPLTENKCLEIIYKYAKITH